MRMNAMNLDQEQQVDQSKDQATEKIEKEKEEGENQKLTTE